MVLPAVNVLNLEFLVENGDSLGAAELYFSQSALADLSLSNKYILGAADKLLLLEDFHNPLESKLPAVIEAATVDLARVGLEEGEGGACINIRHHYILSIFVLKS